MPRGRLGRVQTLTTGTVPYTVRAPPVHARHLQRCRRSLLSAGELRSLADVLMQTITFQMNASTDALKRLRFDENTAP
jgi:hypothetical protein